MKRHLSNRSGVVLPILGLLLVFLAPPGGVAQSSQEDLEREFEELLEGSDMIGYFTVTGMDLPAQEDSYSVSKLEKMDDGRWLFTASMSYGDNTIAIPMPFDVIWSGDTPVITVSDQLIEGLGTFSARVLIYDGLYAGTWKHDAFGGHMWGKIEKKADAGEEEEP